MEKQQELVFKVIVNVEYTNKDFYTVFDSKYTYEPLKKSVINPDIFTQTIKVHYIYLHDVLMQTKKEF